MKLSVGLYPNVPARTLCGIARLAEDLGYDRLWLADSHLLWREVYTLLGALAAETRTIGLATAVTNPLTRHPSVTAAAFATLVELAGDRVALGISIGDSALRTLHLEPAKRAELEQAVGYIRDLLSGAAAAEPMRLAYAPERPVPIYVAATGPRMLRLAGRIADGVILMNGVAPELVSAAIALVREGASEAARPDGRPAIVVWAAAHASIDAPERSPDAVKYNVARAVLRDVPGADALSRQTAARLRTVYDYRQHGDAAAGFAALVPDELVARFAFAGTPADVRRQVAALAPLGVDEVALAVPHLPETGGREDVLRLLAPVAGAETREGNSGRGENDDAA